LALRRELIKTNASLVGGKAEYGIARTFTDGKFMNAGLLVLPKGSKKPDKNSGANTIVSG
jgi:hypothetical protein